MKADEGDDFGRTGGYDDDEDCGFEGSEALRIATLALWLACVWVVIALRIVVDAARAALSPGVTARRIAARIRRRTHGHRVYRAPI